MWELQIRIHSAAHTWDIWSLIGTPIGPVSWAGQGLIVFYDFIGKRNPMTNSWPVRTRDHVSWTPPAVSEYHANNSLGRKIGYWNNSLCHAVFHVIRSKRWYRSKFLEVFKTKYLVIFYGDLSLSVHKYHISLTLHKISGINRNIHELLHSSLSPNLAVCTHKAVGILIFWICI